MKHLVTIVLLIILFSITEAQNERFKIENSDFTSEEKNYSDGNIYIEQNVGLRKIIKKHISSNENKFPGWRVQIYFGSGQTALAKAKGVKEDFLYKFGQKYSSYIVYDAPYFKVRVGDFRTKAEALKFKQEISKKFSSTWIVPDKVNYSDIIE